MTTALRLRHVESAISDLMEARGWCSQVIGQLWAVYARESTITPYFFCAPLRTAKNGYCIVDGSVGVIHREFEYQWMQTHTKDEADSGFAMTLNIANFPSLHEKRVIFTDRAQPGVESFGLAVLDILTDMPMDLRSLRASFSEGGMCGIPMAHFCSYVNRRKFVELQNFIGVTWPPESARGV